MKEGRLFGVLGTLSLAVGIGCQQGAAVACCFVGLVCFISLIWDWKPF